jgi:hypothetical protein
MLGQVTLARNEPSCASQHIGSPLGSDGSEADVTTLRDGFPLYPLKADIEVDFANVARSHKLTFALVRMKEAAY